MKKFLIGIVALLSPSLAFAADLPPLRMPVKAAVAAPLPLFYGGAGAYCGAGTGGEATKVASTGTGTSAATYEAGGLLNFNCGYVSAVGVDRWAAIQANYAYSNVDAKTLCGTSLCAVDNKQSFDVKAMYGAPLSVLSGLFSNAAAGFPALPGVPTGAINTTAHPYISAGVRVTQDRTMIDALVTENKTKVKGLIGLGVIYQTNSNTTINTFADWTFGSGKFLITPGSEIKVGSTFRMGVTVNYGLAGLGF